MVIECHGDCGKSYTDCLKHRGIDLKEDNKEMSKLSNRNIAVLFSRKSATRINVSHITKFNEGKFSV